MLVEEAHDVGAENVELGGPTRSPACFEAGTGQPLGDGLGVEMQLAGDLRGAQTLLLVELMDLLVGVEVDHGLPPEEPSWGRLLHEGTENFNYPWIVGAAFTALASCLILITFVGEAVREAFDPKKYTTYQ